MRYIVTVAQEQADGSAATVSSAYETRAAAFGAYHSELASAYVADKLASDTVALFGTDGTLYALEHVDLGEAGK